MSKPTPGPWHASGNAKSVGIYTEDGSQVALIPFVGIGQGRAIERAELIAAAPNMLSALRKAVLALAHASETSPGLYSEAYEEVSATIAKATGAQP